jgi:8-oxo-dGTP pyrophosphatase MutT (NUDIX family)
MPASSDDFTFDAAHPFRPLGETLLYQGYVIGLYTTKWTNEAGEEFERDVVRHRGAVAIVPIVDDGDAVLLVRQFRVATNCFMLELPAGLCDIDGEPPIDTAHRELGEEVGHVAAKMELLSSMKTAVGFADETIHIFIATDLTETETAYEGIEEQIMTTVKVRFDELDEMITSGELVDAKTISGMLMARVHLAAGKAASPAIPAG